jgi:hypothetical protein
MSRSAVRYFRAATLFIASSIAHATSGQTGGANLPARPPAQTQESEKDYADRVRKTAALNVAKAVLKSRQLTFVLDLVRHNPNGHFIIGSDTVTVANVEEYARRFDRERQILIDVIRQRGFLNIAGVYELQRDSKNECDLSAEVVGPFTIRQDDFNVELKEPSLPLLAGIIVESSMAAEPSEPGTGDIFFVGQVSDRQIEIGFAGEGMACKIGMLVKRGK